MIKDPVEGITDAERWKQLLLHIQWGCSIHGTQEFHIAFNQDIADNVAGVGRTTDVLRRCVDASIIEDRATKALES